MIFIVILGNNSCNITKNFNIQMKQHKETGFINSPVGCCQKILGRDTMTLFIGLYTTEHQYDTCAHPILCGNNSNHDHISVITTQLSLSNAVQCRRSH